MAVTSHPQIPENSEWSISTCADEPKCNGQHLTVLTQMETFSSTHMSVAWIWCLTNTQHSSYAWIIALALQKFQSFEDVVDHPIQRCIPHYSPQSRCTPAVSSHLFPGSVIGHWHTDPTCKQKHICSIAAHSQASPVSLVQFNNLFCNMFSHLPVTMHTASTKQGHPHNSMWCTEHHIK